MGIDFAARPSRVMTTMNADTFRATLESRPRGGIVIRLPYDPNAAWGEKDRHDAAGTIGGHRYLRTSVL
jgi:hypothetical protein